MAGCITEEQITKNILIGLEAQGWQIICFDFPQSGTGIRLHPNKSIRTSKNKGAFIPDIVAHRNETVIFIENKDRFVIADFEKQNSIKNDENYSESIQNLLSNLNYSKIFFGIGMPDTPSNKIKCNKHQDKIDFIILLKIPDRISIYYEVEQIF